MASCASISDDPTPRFVITCCFAFVKLSLVAFLVGLALFEFGNNNKKQSSRSVVLSTGYRTVHVQYVLYVLYYMHSIC